MPGGPETAARPPLTDVLGQVLGDLAFLVSDDDPPKRPPGLTWLHGVITYAGPLRGRLDCWCSPAFATQLAANLLGLDPRDSEAAARAEDAVREFMNVVCGQIVTAWHGHEAVFDLSIPTVSESRDAPAVEAAGETGCGLSVGGEPFFCTHTAG